ncbi:MAG TPA: ATP-binding protein [Nocardioidaceae bacterium]|nr:ATP-binding protein [Nocardioidaceae bacterium]
MRDNAFVGVGTAEFRVRMAADPASVPGARRFVTDGLLSWGLAALVDDATLCVSELAANAALHSASTFMEIAMRPLEDAVRISVEDDGRTPAEAVVPRAGFPDPDDDLDVLALNDEPTTGRGLAIVSILATEWGVEKTEGGKRIWADIPESSDEHGVRLPRTNTEETPDPLEGGLPGGWGLVRLEGCPVRLSLRQDQHLDELVRELQLIAADRDNPRSRVLAQELQGLLSGPAHARHTGRRIAQQAAAAGKEYIDVDMAMPREFSVEVQALQAAVKAADALCEEATLLTLASSPELRALRAWMTEQIVHQLEDGAGPVSWNDWLARRN